MYDSKFIVVADLDLKTVLLADLDTLQFKPLLPLELKRPAAVGYDPVDRRVYWTDILNKTIESCFLDGTGHVVILHLSENSGT